MFMPDINVLIYAHREEQEDHKKYADYVLSFVNSGQPFALSELVAAGFIRIVTRKGIFSKPTTPEIAWQFIDSLIELENCHLIRPGNNHFQIFKGLCSEYKLKGKITSDAYHAALAIENACTWVTADTDFAKFQDKLKLEIL